MMGKKVEAFNALKAIRGNEDQRFLIFGRTGWIGGLIGDLMESHGRKFVYAESRLENREQIMQEIRRVQPTHVIHAAGVTGRPNVDWCEDHKAETIRANVIGTLNLCDICHSMNIHCTVFATGCIFEYDGQHALGSGVGFTEEDHPNFAGSFYSYTKGMVEDLLRFYERSILVLRVRMPISDDLSPRNFLTKISKYERVVNIPNSMSILTDLLPVSIIMAERSLEGIYNFTNPGVISHNQCLDLYREYVDPTFTYKNFTEAEQAKILKAARSNNELDSTKLQEALPDIHIPPIQDSIHLVYARMVENLKKNGNFPPVREDKVLSQRRGDTIVHPNSTEEKHVS